MAGTSVPDGYLTAGEQYRQAMKNLGLVPSFLGWGWDTDGKNWVLVMVTSIVDAGGPLELNKLLFDAYNANATPREISPFMVRVFSPEIVPAQVLRLGESDVFADLKTGGALTHFLTRGSNRHETFLGIELEAANCYPNPPASEHRDGRKEWARFRRNVERVAA